MATLSEIVFILASCGIVSQTPACLNQSFFPVPPVSQVSPQRTGSAVDVVLSAEAAVVWDVESGEILYRKQSDTRRPVASLTKLLSLLYLRTKVAPEQLVTIPPEVRVAQAQGAHIRLPMGEEALASQLMAAALTASANDAVVTLALAAAPTEEVFTEQANLYAASLGLRNTKAANATGLSGGEQYSTAEDIKQLLTLAARDPLLGPALVAEEGVLTTLKGNRRAYKTTNKLLGTYLPVIAAKTGYTIEAGENLALITIGKDNQRIGAVILGSANRFQDMKVLIEWIWRNYEWKQ